MRFQDQLHTILDDFARTYCPVIDRFQLTYHWSIMQTEYATDIVFWKQGYLQGMYDTLARTAIHTVKRQTIATFLGKNCMATIRMIWETDSIPA